MRRTSWWARRDIFHFVETVRQKARFEEENTWRAGEGKRAKALFRSLSYL